MGAVLKAFKNVRGRWYTVSLHASASLLKISARRSRFHLYVPLVSACDQPGKRDVHQALSKFCVTRRGNTTILTYTETSDLWERKEYTYEFHPDRIVHYYRVFGRGPVGHVNFFRSWMDDPTTVEQELGVVPGFDTVFSPAVNFMGKVFHFAGDTSIITSGDDQMYWGSGLASAPFCFCLNDRSDNFWLWAGLGVRPGKYTFETFSYNENTTKRIYGAGGFACNYNGKLLVDGSWESPHIVLGAARDPYEGLTKYVGMLKRHYGLSLPRRHKNIPTWWRSPIFCGWGDQMSLGYREHGNVEGIAFNAYCTQKLHDHWLHILRRHRIRPGQIIIDAGWEQPGTTGDLLVNETRWPDLRGWIEARREEGIRTHLWMCAWNRDGVPDDECITRQDGTPVAPDPTNPKHERRLRAMVRRLLTDAPEGYNADGLKIDGQMNCPLGPGLRNTGNIWGLELQRCYLRIVYDEAKACKPEALVGTFFANPYLADLSDVVRTADQFSIKSSPEDTMRHRARLLSIAMPGCPIDTDHAFWYDLRENWIDIMQAQLTCGIPCLYHAQYVWHKRPFCRPYIEEMTDAQYAAIRRAFNTQWRLLGTRPQ
ncbi:MAG: hypothetical protein WCS52_00925 [bacterium]